MHKAHKATAEQLKQLERLGATPFGRRSESSPRPTAATAAVPCVQCGKPVDRHTEAAHETDAGETRCAGCAIAYLDARQAEHALADFVRHRGVLVTWPKLVGAAVIVLGGLWAVLLALDGKTSSAIENLRTEMRAGFADIRDELRSRTE